MLVSMAVLVLLLTFIMQMLSGTTATIAASNRQMDTAALARIVLDRFGNDFSGALLTGGATALYYEDAGNTGNSAIAFVATSRARGPTSATGPWATDTRSAFIGYRVRAVAQNIAGGTPALPSLNRGDGRFTFATRNAANKATYNLWDAFGTGNNRIPNDLTAATNDQELLNWQIIASAIFRFHISFVLDDGRVVQTPPAFNNFFANGGTGSCTPITFSAATSSDPSRRYVTGLVVGVTVLDESTRNLAYQVDNAFWTTAATKLRRPNTNGETPVQVWSRNLETLTSNDPTDPAYLFPPIRQNVRFYQRFYSVSL